jgi:hypothetical protein
MDRSLNPTPMNLGRSFESRTYDSSASFPKHYCRYCGCEGDIIHEQMCKLNPENKKIVNADIIQSALELQVKELFREEFEAQTRIYNQLWYFTHSNTGLITQ